MRLCVIGLHKWGKTWHLTGSGKVQLFKGTITDVWWGYHKCENCKKTKSRTEFVYTMAA